MDIQERVNADFLLAFKSGDTFKKTLLGVIKGEFQNEASRKDGASALEVLLRMQKSLLQVDTEESRKELEIIKNYLPQPLSEEETLKLVTELKESGLNRGQIMGVLSKDYKGRVDNKFVSTLF